MTTFEIARRTSGTAARAAAMLSAARTVWHDAAARFAARRRARHTALVLRGLSDHELKDIGLTRFDIGQVAQAVRARAEHSGN